MSHAMQHWFIVAALAVSALAAVIDLRTGHIPDWLTLGLLGLAPVARGAAAFVHHHSWHSALLVASFSVLSGVGAGIIPALLARSGGLGGGDVKLFAAIGAACGIFVGFYAQTYAYVFAMVQAILVVLRQNKLKRTLENIKGLFMRRVTTATVTAGAEVGVGGTGVATASQDFVARHAGFTEVKFAPAIFVGLVVAAWAQWKW